MRVKVHMTACGKQGQVRLVDVPGEQITDTDDALTGTNLLDLVFHYAQNEVQSREHPSMSAGDVVELDDGRLVMCCDMGWREITPRQFEVYQQEAYPQSKRPAAFIALFHPLVRKDGNDLRHEHKPPEYTP